MIPGNPNEQNTSKGSDSASGLMNKIFNKNKKESDDLFSIMSRIHHDMMKEYGWIPLDEFYMLPMDFINAHIKHINDDRKRENSQNKKSKRLRRGR